MSAIRVLSLVFLNFLSVYGADLISSRCGGIYSNSTVGQAVQVQYKAVEAYEPNERCVFIVRAPGATEYNVDIMYLGFPYPTRDHRVVFSAFGFEGLQHSKIGESIGESFSLNGTVLVIAFQTGENPTGNLRGFIVSVTPRIGTGRPAAPTSSNYIAEYNLWQTWLHPTGGALYDMYDLSIFVFLQGGSYHRPNSGLDVVFTIKSFANSAGCNDQINFFRYDLETGEWRYVSDYLCDYTPPTMMSGNDMLLARFKAGSTLENVERGAGFYFHAFSGYRGCETV